MTSYKDLLDIVDRNNSDYYEEDWNLERDSILCPKCGTVMQELFLFDYSCECCGYTKVGEEEF